MQTPRGLLVFSENATAAERFADHVRLLADSNSPADRQLAVFYMKHAKVEDANTLLRQLLADESLASSSPLSLARFPSGDVSETGSLGHYWNYATATVIPDKRLNRMFVYANQLELEAIEQHLQVIDRENSIADLKTRGTPRVIRLRHAKAAAVADVIRDAYAGRIAATASERSAAAAAAVNRNNRQGSNSSDANEDATAVDQRRPDLHPPAGTAEEMTLAIDNQSNTLVVTAPSKLADQVEELAELIDRESEQSIHLIPMNVAQMKHIQESLQQLYSTQKRGQDSF